MQLLIALFEWGIFISIALVVFTLGLQAIVAVIALIVAAVGQVVEATVRHDDDDHDGWTGK